MRSNGFVFADTHPERAADDDDRRFFGEASAVVFATL